ncbi:MAG: altronate dehydratase [Rhodobacterales bacterium]|nr:altronate dehydratase [Rhodobacterales bacterium]
MRALRLHTDDDVAVALADLAPGTPLDLNGATAAGPVPAGHKVALRPIARGAPVRKYGQVIGAATADIAPGEHVHTHNLGMAEPGAGPVAASHAQATGAPLGAPRTFQGFHRPSGRVGTRNYLGVLTSVNCSGSVARFIAREFERSGGLDAFPNVDGVVPLSHAGGCGMASDGEGFDTLARTLRGYAGHPNFGGVLLVGLGCEVMQVAALAEGLGDDRFRHMTIQEAGGTRASVDRGVALLHALAARANDDRRAAAPASALTLGLQCGGSDGHSGLTANPALGVAADLLVAQGGTAILSETPEIHGAEHLLTARCEDPAVARALMDRMAWWEDHVRRHGGSLDNNPSPGNKAGGLTTILEKSLGAVAKGGSSPLVGVYRYGQAIDRPGFVFMDSPGYDPCSVTGQVASGANLLAFTTGRGSVSGFKPVPCIKLATNKALYARMGDDMDVACGDVLDGVPIADKGREIFDTLLDVASGRPTRSEALGFGDVEFVPWILGATL